jgi:hypothetical protein
MRRETWVVFTPYFHHSALVAAPKTSILTLPQAHIFPFFGVF